MSVLFSKAELGQCRWIVCDTVPQKKGEPRDTFGGRRVCGAPVLGFRSYCLGHHLRAYAPSRPLRHPLTTLPSFAARPIPTSCPN